MLQTKKGKGDKNRAKTVGKVKEKAEGNTRLMEEVKVAAQIYGFKPLLNARLGGKGGDINIMVVTQEKQKLVLKVSDG